MSMINQVNVNGVDYYIEGTGGGVTDVKVSQNGTDYSSVVDGGVAKIDLSERAKQSDLTTHTSDTGVHVNSTEKGTWNGKYSKPTDGIPKTDLESDVQTSLGKADTALQAHQTIATGGANGTIAVGGSDVAVKGLGSAAYTNSSDYATSAQGAKADTAYQKESTGIPKTDLASGVQGSLDKADTISGSETWTFELDGGGTVTKKILLAV